MERAKVASEQIPVAFGDEFYDEKRGDIVKFESDVAPFKPRADIVLVGKAHAPGERMVQAFDVSLRVGQIIKKSGLSVTVTGIVLAAPSRIVTPLPTLQNHGSYL